MVFILFISFTHPGTEVRASADQRRKAAYRQDLQKQMQETKANRKR